MKYLRIGSLIITTDETLRPVSRAVSQALHVGEIHFETCALSRDSKCSLTVARDILRKLLRRPK